MPLSVAIHEEGPVARQGQSGAYVHAGCGLCDPALRVSDRYLSQPCPVDSLSLQRQLYRTLSENRQVEQDVSSGAPNQRESVLRLLGPASAEAAAQSVLGFIPYL